MKTEAHFFPLGIVLSKNNVKRNTGVCKLGEIRIYKLNFNDYVAFIPKLILSPVSHKLHMTAVTLMRRD